MKPGGTAHNSVGVYFAVIRENFEA